MKKILLTSVCAIVAASSAMASSFDPFIGINADYTFNNLQKERYDAMKDGGYEMQRHLFGAGAELGFRMLGDHTYNIGLTGSYDFFGSREVKIDKTVALEDAEGNAEETATINGIDKYSTTYQAAGLSLDNYIRVGGVESGHRSDVILGVGYAHLLATVDMKYTDASKIDAAKMNFDSDALSAKIGFQHEFAKGWSWNIMARAFFAARKYDQEGPQLQNMFTGSLGIKYTF